MPHKYIFAVCNSFKRTVFMLDSLAKAKGSKCKHLNTEVICLAHFKINVFLNVFLNFVFALAFFKIMLFWIWYINKFCCLGCKTPFLDFKGLSISTELDSCVRNYSWGACCLFYRNGSGINQQCICHIFIRFCIKRHKIFSQVGEMKLSIHF